MPSALQEYYEALDRLKSNKTIRVSKGTKISKDAVALEAGRKRGSIKNSRAIFSELIVDIKNAKNEQKDKKIIPRDQTVKAKFERDHYKKLYEESLGRELSMLRQIDMLKTEIGKIKQYSVRRVK